MTHTERALEAWFDARPRERLGVLVLIGLFMTFVIAAAQLLVLTFPYTETVEVERVEVVRKEVVSVPVPIDQKFEPLDDPAKVCSGAPGVVVTAMTQEHDDKWTTWFTLRPAGDSYVVPCQIEGAWVKEFPEGSLISLPNGRVSG